MGNRPKRADTALIDGIKVRALRESAGLTQELLATEVTGLGWHLSQGYLPSLEKKPAARVHKQLATALATALGITVNELTAALPQGSRGKQGSGRRMSVLRTAGGEQNAPLEPSAGAETISTRRRRGVVLASPLIGEPPSDSGSVDTTTIGQDIDAALKEEGFLEVALREEYDKLRQSLVSHVRQLSQLYKLAKRGKNEADLLMDIEEPDEEEWRKSS